MPPAEPRRSLAAAVALAALSGTLYFVGYVGFEQLYLTWICFVPGLVALEGASPRRALLLGTVLGTVMSVGGFYWVAGLLVEFAGASPAIGWVGLVALAVEQGLGLGVVLWAVRRLDQRLGLPPVWTLPLALTAQELVWWQLFPFYIGASQYRFTWINQLVDIFGIVGLAALIGVVNGGVYELVAAARGRRRAVTVRWAVPLAAFLIALGYGALRTAQLDALVAAAPKLDVGLIQTNIGARSRATRAGEFTERHRVMSEALEREHPELDLLVWPETAYTRWVARSAERLDPAAFRGLRTPVVLGLPTYVELPDGDKATFNSVAITSSTGAMLGSFDKMELVMFGETVPLASTFPGLGKRLGLSGLWTRGERFVHLVLPAGPGGRAVRLLPMICYEDIKPAFLREMWSRAGSADALINVTNDSWYGDSTEPMEHLALATYRSIETHRALIRSTNTGVSALVDPAGRIVARTGQWTQETLVGAVPLLPDGPTPLYQLWGDGPMWLLALVFLGLLVRSRGARA